MTRLPDDLPHPRGSVAATLPRPHAWSPLQSPRAISNEPRRSPSRAVSAVVLAPVPIASLAWPAPILSSPTARPSSPSLPAGRRRRAAGRHHYHQHHRQHHRQHHQRASITGQEEPGLAWPAQRVRRTSSTFGQRSSRLTMTSSHSDPLTTTVSHVRL